jgi:prevent-host-death family protein
MNQTATISKTDLARRTRQVMDRVRRGHTLVVESYGQEQAVLVDVVDYRVLRAMMAYHNLPPHPAPANDPTLEPQGLSEEDLDHAVREAGGGPQARWNLVLGAYLDQHINLGRAAVLLGLSTYELGESFRRLDVPRRIGPETEAEAQAETDVALTLLSGERE